MEKPVFRAFQSDWPQMDIRKSGTEENIGAKPHHASKQKNSLYTEAEPSECKLVSCLTDDMLRKTDRLLRK